MIKKPDHDFSTKARGCLLALFGLPFFAVGCYMAFHNIRMIADYCVTRNWVETPATILKADCTGGTVLDEGYLVTCTYRYSFNGRQYEGSRVGLCGMGDNFDSWQQDTHTRLQQAVGHNEAVPCYVNPSHPERAILDRTLRWQMVLMLTIFAFCFGGLGGTFLVVGILGTPANRYARRMAQLCPNEPWRWQKRWATNVIHSRGRRELAVKWAAATIAMSVTFAIFAVMGKEAMCFSVLGLPVALVILLGLVQETKCARGTCSIRLTLETMPGFIGKPLKGNLIVKRSMPTLSKIILSLRCVETGPHDSSVKPVMLWEDRRTNCRPIASGLQPNTVWSVDFEIPESCEPSDDCRAGKKVSWEVGFQATTGTRNIDLAFEVPVFRVAEGPEAAALTGQAACVDISRVVSLGERR